jgi:hypothetical protein
VSRHRAKHVASVKCIRSTWSLIARLAQLACCTRAAHRFRDARQQAVVGADKYVAAPAKQRDCAALRTYSGIDDKHDNRGRRKRQDVRYDSRRTGYIERREGVRKINNVAVGRDSCDDRVARAYVL